MASDLYKRGRLLSTYGQASHWQVLLMLATRIRRAAACSLAVAFLVSAQAGVGVWTQGSGMYGGTVQALAVDALGAVYAGSNGGGILKSLDGGNTWVALNNGLGNLYIDALAIDRRGIIYAGSYFQGGVFKSSDGGATWQAINAGLSNSNVYCLAIAADGSVYAGTQGGGVFRRGNGAASWAAVNSGLGSLDVRALAIADTGTLYAGTSAGIYRSNDGAASWAARSSGLANLAINALIIDPIGNIYAGSDGAGVYKSVDNASNWQAMNAGLASNRVYALAFDAVGSVYAGSNGGIYASRNGGARWAAINNGLPGNANVAALAADAGNTLFAGVYGGGASQYTTGLVPRFVAVSARAAILQGDNLGIAGFIISGGKKTVLINAKGPSLAAAGLGDVLRDPRLKVANGDGTIIASNDNVEIGPNSPGPASQQGVPTDLLESALLLTLDTGAYTAIMEGADGGSGNGLVEVFSVVDPTETGTLTSVSFRGWAGAGDSVVIAGFIIQDGPKKVLVSARGPSLVPLGVLGALDDPRLELFAGSTLLDSNDDQTSAANYPDIIASGRAPGQPREPAILRTLQPGVYTVVVRGAGGSQGTVLVTVDQVD